MLIRPSPDRSRSDPVGGGAAARFPRGATAALDLAADVLKLCRLTFAGAAVSSFRSLEE